MFKNTEEGKWREHRSVRIERKRKGSLSVSPTIATGIPGPCALRICSLLILIQWTVCQLLGKLLVGIEGGHPVIRSLLSRNPPAKSGRGRKMYTHDTITQGRSWGMTWGVARGKQCDEESQLPAHTALDENKLWGGIPWSIHPQSSLSSVRYSEYMNVGVCLTHSKFIAFQENSWRTDNQEVSQLPSVLGFILCPSLRGVRVTQSLLNEGATASEGTLSITRLLFMFFEQVFAYELMG